MYLRHDELLFGISTYLLCNNKRQKVVSSKFDVLGLHTVKAMSQFDIKTETGVDSLKEGMPVIGLNALRAFLEANRKRPFQYTGLKQISETAEEDMSLSYAVSSP